MPTARPRTNAGPSRWPPIATSSRGSTPYPGPSASRTWFSPQPAGTECRHQGPYAGLREALLGDDGPITSTVLARRTQTNEVGRRGHPDAGAGSDLPGVRQAPRARRSRDECGAMLYPARFDYAWTGDAGSVRAASTEGLGRTRVVVCRARRTEATHGIPGHQASIRHRPQPTRRHGRGRDGLVGQSRMARRVEACGPTAPSDCGCSGRSAPDRGR